MPQGEPIRVLVVDDEPLARQRVRTMLQAEPRAVIAGECGSGAEAVGMIVDLGPDLVFLDVQMPAGNGFDVIEAVGPEQMPLVIFVTAYDQHAVEAFEVHALDYLLKPFDPERFRKAWQRAVSELDRRKLGVVSGQLQRLLATASIRDAASQRLLIRGAGSVVILPTSQVDWIESAGNYVKVHAGKENHLMRETMSNLESRLAGEGFVRIHRTVLVRAERIKVIRPEADGDFIVVLQDGTKLSMSRRYRAGLADWFGETPSA